MLRTIILISFLSLIFSVTAFAQLSDEIVGKIYDKTEADELYGPVQRSFRMNTIALEKVLTRVNNFVLFKMKNDIPVIADEHRRVVFTRGAVGITDEDV
ncbi:MAG: hypothetical protein K9J16_18770, partial [Melioribacteraceae bacterium]|nr:hypothetical protein [Melioribacteraceae bacterium]